MSLNEFTNSELVEFKGSKKGIIVNIKTPMIMPETLPTPPFNDTPPTTHAAIASNS